MSESSDIKKFIGECEIIDETCEGIDLFMEEIPPLKSYKIGCIDKDRKKTTDGCISIDDLNKIFSDNEKQIASRSYSGNPPVFKNPYNSLPFTEDTKNKLRDKVFSITKRDSKLIDDFINDFCEKLNPENIDKKDRSQENIDIKIIDSLIKNDILHLIIKDSKLSNENKQKLIKCLGKYVDLNKRIEPRNTTILYEIISSNLGIDPKLLEILIESNDKIDLNIRNLNGETLLFAASRKNDKESIKVLLDAGAKIDMPDYEGITPMMHASQHSYLDIVKFLVEKGANVNKKSTYGYTALSLNMGFLDRDEKIVKILLDAGADPNIIYTNSMTPLLYAAYYKENEIVELLVDAGADVNAKNRDGTNAFMYGTDDILNILAKGNININFKDEEGKTYLHLAAERGLEPAVELLLEKGANPDIKDYGKTPDYYSTQNGYTDITDIIKRAQKEKNKYNIFPTLNWKKIKDSKKGGGSQYVTHNNKKYKVYRGQRGGTYINIRGNKKYI